MLSREFEYKDHFGVIRMIAERDYGPFDKYTIGHFEKNEDGYFVFEPSNGVQMTCKQLREAAKKAGELNT